MSLLVTQLSRPKLESVLKNDIVQHLDLDLCDIYITENIYMQFRNRVSFHGALYSSSVEKPDIVLYCMSLYFERSF